MKGRKVFIAGIFAVVVIIFVIIAIAIAGHIENDVNKINFYFLNPLTNELETEEKVIISTTEKDMLEEALSQLLKGPKNTGFVNAVPNDLKIIKCTYIKGATNVAEINFSQEYENMSNSKEFLCRCAVVWTLTEFDFIDNVSILVDGKPLLRANEQEVGLLNRDNVILNAAIEPEPKQNTTVVLYFSDEQAMGLVAENRSIEVKQSQSVENSIVEELIKGPFDAGHYPTIPTETKIRNIKTEDNVCYVDLTNDFVTKHSGGSTAETLTIYSIVNSLTELANVSKVQFLIDGEKVSEFKGHIDFSKTFERNEAIIIK